ncbi:hypothetical protein ACS260_12920 [Acinetobacter baumannii]
MKKLMLAVAPVVLALTACATTTGTGTGGASAQTTTQQLGVAALKVAVNAKCITEILCTRQISQNPYPIRVLPS